MSERQVLKAEDFSARLNKEWVPIPEWPRNNGHEAGVYVRELDAVESEIWEDEVTDDRGRPIPGRVMQCAITRAVVDESGKPIFTKEQAAQLSGRVAGRLYRVFKRLNVATDADVEGAAKN